MRGIPCACINILIVKVKFNLLWTAKKKLFNLHMPLSGINK